MTEPTVNIPLLRKAVEWAEAEAAKGFERSEWYQADWVVTPEMRAEFARVQRAHGATQVLGVASKAPECGTCYCIAGYVTHEIEAVPVGSNHPSWIDIARPALGLNEHQADQLFAANNTIEDVRRIAESIAGERL